MSKDENIQHRHLVSRIPNTEDNRSIVKEVNKLMKKSNSLYRLYIRYRSPIEGHKYGYGGNLKREHAKTFSIYMDFGGTISDIGYYKNRTKVLAKEVNSLRKTVNQIEEILKWK